MSFWRRSFPRRRTHKGLNRRRWLQVMGASFALAGVAGCGRKQELLPFAQRPEDRVPGKPQQYATAMDLSGSAIGLLVTCVDGRPIKVEGNPDHPQSLGATPLAGPGGDSGAVRPGPQPAGTGAAERQFVGEVRRNDAERIWRAWRSVKGRAWQ